MWFGIANGQISSSDSDTIMAGLSFHDFIYNLFYFYLLMIASNESVLSRTIITPSNGIDWLEQTVYPNQIRCHRMQHLIRSTYIPFTTLPAVLDTSTGSKVDLLKF